MSETRLEDLGDGMMATVSPIHTFGTDAMALAYFAAPKKSTVACDLGSGCGIIPLLFLRDGLCRHVTAVEIQDEACAQMRNSIGVNHLEGKFNVVHHDLRTLTEEDLPLYSFDLVTMNPPYKAPNAGIKSTGEAALIARHEVMCQLDDVTKAAAKLLKFGGRLCICHRPERLTDAICSMRENGIEPKRIRMLSHTWDKKPSIFLLEGKRGANSGMIIEPTLVIKNPDGTFTEEGNRMYGSYQNERTAP